MLVVVVVVAAAAAAAVVVKVAPALREHSTYFVKSNVDRNKAPQGNERGAIGSKTPPLHIRTFVVAT